MPFLEKLIARYELLALPQFILDEDFRHNLDSSTKNRELADVLRKDSKVARQIDPGVSLQTTASSVALIDDTNDDLPVAFLYLFLPMKFRGVDAVQEKHLWKDTDSKFAGLHVDGKPLTQYTVFDIFLKEHDAVVSDMKHTKHGRAFWVRLIRHAFDVGLNVYVEAEKELFTFRKEDVDDLLASFWGHSTEFQKVLLVISKVALNQ